jgi:microcystin-dependent protein
MILPFGGTTAPDGFLDCDGSAISRTTYADLFAAIGTTWGVGDGSTTFNVPDLRGVGLRGSGQHGSRTKADSTAYDGGSVGNEQNDQMQGHWHNIERAGTNSANPGSSGPSGTGDGLSSGGPNTSNQNMAKNYLEDTDNSYGTPRTGDETRGATSAVLFVIKT